MWGLLLVYLLLTLVLSVVHFVVRRWVSYPFEISPNAKWKTDYG